jgi:hypothetical protein
MSSIEDRVRNLEAIEAIKALKARYWYSCDHKDVEQVRQCFADGPVEIDYAGSTGKVSHRDELYAVFEKVACRPQIVELHHGGPPRIELIDETTARGVWSLYYHLMDTERQTVHHVGGYYHDEYARIDGEWKIRKTRFEVVSAVGYRWKEAGLKVLFASSGLPEPK